jgi:SAM-dependent methyltransferase
MAAHWTDGYYGALYLDSVADLLTPALSAVEADAVAALLAIGPRDRVLDLACGHGRHALPLARRAGAVTGLDRSGDYLRRAAGDAASRVRVGERAPAFVRGDVRALPFAAGTFDAVFSWYASLFPFDDPTNEACLAEAARVVRPGGRLLVEHANPLALAAEPVAEAARTLPDGSRVEERSRWDAGRGVDVSSRRIIRPGGAVLAGTAELRYYMPSEWRSLAERTGLRLVALTSTPGAAAPRRNLGPEDPDLIALLEKPA